MKNIILVEDEHNLGSSLSEFLESKYGKCSWYKDCQSALNHQEKIDLALLDIGLPDGNGLDLSEKLKLKNPNINFLFLSAQNDPQLKVRALENGGLDFITKPFALKELTLRMERFVKESPEIVLGPLKFNRDSYEITYSDGKKKLLGAKEVGILTLFLDNPGKVLSREEIIEKIWGIDSFPSNRTVDNYIVNLRKWFDSVPNSANKIISVRGIGYKFEMEKS